jgi:glutamyl/glutaminyl-tRNA synthetase
MAACRVLPASDIARLAPRLPRHPVTRFAPAPTGYLHLGHVLNAEYVWGVAGRLDGRVILRIEDHDRVRSRPQFETTILEDLDWLGYRADMYTTDDYRSGVCPGRQSDRGDVYMAALTSLANRDLVYGCECSRRSMTVSGQSAEAHYAGRCRGKNIALETGVGWRLRMEPGVETFEDARLGPQAQDPSAQCGDLLLRDRNGNWTYQFAVTVDDWQQGVDLVIRGMDLLPSTGRQMRLARLLGRERMPVYFHHPLIMKSPDQKLSKSDGDTGIRELRRRGWTAEEVRRTAREAIERS